MSDERILEVVERQDKYYILGFINGLKANRDELLRENEELKKQLKEVTEDYKRMLDNFNVKVDILQRVENQQQEFIKYLEKEIIDCKAGSGQQYYAQEHLKMFKEIIGVEND